MANNDKDNTLPSFSGNQMPVNISIVDEDEIGEETTRRVGGFNPSFASVNISPPHVFGADIITTTSKTTTTTTTEITTAASTTKSIAQIASVAAWNLPYAPSVPPFGHPLEPTAVFVPHTTASIVSKRVSSILQERNVQATYKKHEAECLTMDNVEFSVFLYRGKNEYSHGIIVEVQRLFGNSIAFYNDTKAILNGSKDDNYRSTKKTEIPPPLIDDVIADAISLDFALKFLQGDKDVQLLGLQLLSSITNPGKMGTKIASAASMKLASPGSKLLDEIFSIVANVEESSSLVQAMILLSNIALFTTLPTQDIIRTLVNLLSSDKPQVAFLAAKCFATHQIDSDVKEALYSAEKLGRDKHHSGLYTLSSNLLQRCI